MAPSTKRGFGECPQCKGTYSTHWKPPKCQRCGFHLGGTYQPATKKPKSCCPGAVVVIATKEMTIFSMKTSTRDNCSFVMKEGDMFFCGQKDCMSLRATFVSWGVLPPLVASIVTSVKMLFPLKGLLSYLAKKFKITMETVLLGKCSPCYLVHRVVWLLL